MKFIVPGCTVEAAPASVSIFEMRRMSAATLASLEIDCITSADINITGECEPELGQDINDIKTFLVMMPMEHLVIAGPATAHHYNYGRNKW